MKQITEIRASGLSRVMTCLAHLGFENLHVPEEHEAAAEGTAAGEYLAHLLTRPNQIIPSHASNGVEFDDDMRFHAKNVADEILPYAQSQVLCETRIDWVTRSRIVLRGQYDASYVRDGKLYVDDLKYGWRHVEVFENWQLLAYAIGEVIRRQMPFEKIVMRIFQPRPHHEDGPVRAWEITYEELLGYKEQIEQRFLQIAAGNREAVTSAKCKYCTGSAEACSAFNKTFYSSLEYVLEDFKQDSLNDKEISEQLNLIARATDVLKIKSDSLNQLAISRVANGGIIPGYVMEKNYGDRKWKKGISPLVIKTLTGKDITAQEMLSPAKAEKLGVPKELVAKYVERYFVGNKLVRKDTSKLGNKIFGEPPKG